MKVARSGDSSGLSACESKVMAKFSAVFGNVGTCLTESVYDRYNVAAPSDLQVAAARLDAVGATP